MAAQPLTYLDDLAIGAASVASQRAQLAAYDFPGVFTPDVCFRISNTLKFQAELMEQIETSAAQFRLTHGVELPKGDMVKVPDEYKLERLPIRRYFENFCKNDPIAFNHNGRTLTTLVDAANNPQAPGPQTIPQFIQYIGNAIGGGLRFQVNDALSYYVNYGEGNGKVYDKYAMPVILFTANGANAGDVVLGPSTSLHKFGNGGVVITGVSPDVFPGGYDNNNLTQVSANGEKKLVGGVDIDKLNTKYSFPNFLLGEMLYKTPGAKEAVGVHKMYSGDMEFWIKSYPGIFFPYDETKYYLPPGWKMVERADGVIMFFNTTATDNALQSNFPLGSYYILPRGVGLNTVIKDSARYNAIVAAVTPVAALYTPADMASETTQNVLGLVAYMTNLDEIKAGFNIAHGGGKKKTKRTNIIKYMAKSKSKKKYHK